MKKRTFWDIILGINNPHKFREQAKRFLNREVLIYMQNYGKADWRKTEAIADYLISNSNFNFNDKTIQKWFAEIGFKSRISDATHDLRLLGYPIIAGNGKKGYRYADETISDLTEVWTSRWELWQKDIQNVAKQREIDLKLLDAIIEKLTKPEEKEKKEILIEIRAKYRKNEKQEN